MNFECESPETIICNIQRATSVFDIAQIFETLDIFTRDSFFLNHKHVMLCCSSHFFCISSYFFEYINENPRKSIPHVSSNALKCLYDRYILNPNKPLRVYSKNFFLGMAYNYRDDVCLYISRRDIHDRKTILCACIRYGMYRTVRKIVEEMPQCEYNQYFWDFIQSTTSLYDMYNSDRCVDSQKKKLRFQRVRKNSAAILLCLLQKLSAYTLKIHMYNQRYNLWKYITRIVHSSKCLKLLIRTDPLVITKRNDYSKNLRDYLQTISLRHNILFRAYEYSSMDVILYLHRICYDMVPSVNCSYDYKLCIIGAFKNPNFKVFSSSFKYHRKILSYVYEFCVHDPSYIELDIYNKHTPEKYVIKKLRFLHGLSPFPTFFMNELLSRCRSPKIMKALFELYPEYKWCDSIIINAVRMHTNFKEDILYLRGISENEDIIWIILHYMLHQENWISDKIKFMFSIIERAPLHEYTYVAYKQYFTYVPYSFLVKEMKHSEIRLHYMEMYSRLYPYFGNVGNVWDITKNNNFPFLEAMFLLNANFQFFPNMAETNKEQFILKKHMSLCIRRGMKKFISRQQSYRKRQFRMQMNVVLNELRALPSGLHSCFGFERGGEDYERALYRFNGAIKLSNL